MRLNACKLRAELSSVLSLHRKQRPAKSAYHVCARRRATAESTARLASLVQRPFNGRQRPAPPDRPQMLAEVVCPALPPPLYLPPGSLQARGARTDPSTPHGRIAAATTCPSPAWTAPGEGGEGGVNGDTIWGGCQRGREEEALTFYPR